MHQEDGDHDFWHEQDAGSTRGFNHNIGDFPMLESDDNEQSTSGGFNFVPSSGGSSSGSSSMRGLMREDQGDTFQYQNNRGNEVYSADRTASLRFFPSQVCSSRGKSSCESSRDGSSAKVYKSTRDKRGRKTAPSEAPSTLYGKSKSGWLYDGVPVDHVSAQADDDNRDWIPLSTMGTEMSERNTVPSSVASSHVRSRQLPGYESPQMNGSDSVIPFAPMLVGSGSRQREMHNSGMLPFAFYPTGPPVPFITMLPLYNFPSETGHSDASTSHFDREESPDTSRTRQSDQNFDSADSLDQSEILSSSDSMKRGTSVEPSDEHKSDILNSDFGSHWQNLQYGRFCQNPRYNGPFIGYGTVYLFTGPFPMGWAQKTSFSQCEPHHSANELWPSTLSCHTSPAQL